MSESSGSARNPSYVSLPPGVHLVAVLNILVGIFAMFTGGTIAFAVAGGELTLVGSFQLSTVVIGLFHVVAGIGLWKLQAWAWWISFIISFFGLLVNVSIVLIDYTLVPVYFLAMLIRVIILVYLLDPPVRDSFK